MAPRKSKRGESVESGKVVDGGVTQNLNRRVTRSSTAAASSPPVTASLPEKEPAKKKPRKSSKKEDKVKPEDKEVKPEGDEVKAEDSDKKPENEEVKPEGDEVKAEDDEKKPENEEVKPEEKNVSFKKTVIIEHCKQCSCFKTKANLVKNGLEKEVTGIKVLINPEKPRRGCFEVREEGGEAFFTLLDLKRPFQKLKDTDMDEVISDIVEKIK